jgi:hypothetical protein
VLATSEMLPRSVGLRTSAAALMASTAGGRCSGSRAAHLRNRADASPSLGWRNKLCPVPGPFSRPWRRLLGRSYLHVVGPPCPLGGLLWTVGGVAAFTSASTPTRIAGGRFGHAATTAANSGSAGAAGVGAGVAGGVVGGVDAPEPARMLPDLLPPESGTARFPEGTGDSSNPIGVTSPPAVSCIIPSPSLG